MILVFGDLHLKAWNDDYIQAQVNCVLKTLEKHIEKSTNRIIFLGDIFEDRKPDPKTIKYAYNLFDAIEKKGNCYCHVIRGNHDTDCKSNDPKVFTSVLEIFDKSFGRFHYVNECSATGELVNGLNLGLVAHFEDESIIISHMEKLKQAGCNLLFGHFGFDGCLNRELYDFTIPTDTFFCRTVLGHIHKHSQYSFTNAKVTLLGTPYSTSWHDKNNAYYIATYNKDLQDFEYHQTELGVKHLILDYNDISQFITNFQTFAYEYYCIRVMLDPLSEDKSFEDLAKLKELSSKLLITTRFKPILASDSVSTLANTAIETLDEDIIQEYLEETKSQLPREKLLEVLDEIRRED